MTEIDLRLVNLAQENDLVNGTNKVEKYLGGIFRRNPTDLTSPIIGAKATKIDFISETNITEALIHPVFSQVFSCLKRDNHGDSDYDYHSKRYSFHNQFRAHR